jgi:hypothetical protein
LNDTIFEPLSSAEEAAKHLRIHVKTLQKLAREQRVPNVRMVNIGVFAYLPFTDGSLHKRITCSQPVPRESEENDTLKFTRNRYQKGSLRRVSRKSGAGVWEY